MALRRRIPRPPTWKYEMGWEQWPGTGITTPQLDAFPSAEVIEDGRKMASSVMTDKRYHQPTLMDTDSTSQLTVASESEIES